MKTTFNVTTNHESVEVQHEEPEHFVSVVVRDEVAHAQASLDANALDDLIEALTVCKRRLVVVAKWDKAQTTAIHPDAMGNGMAR